MRSPGTEMLIRAGIDGKSIYETGVSHYPRRYGNSTVSGIKDLFNVFKEQIRGVSLLWKENYLS